MWSRDIILSQLALRVNTHHSVGAVSRRQSPVTQYLPSPKLRISIALCVLIPSDLLRFLFCRYLISQHPEVEARILEELDGAGLLMSAQRPSPRKLARDDVACPQQLPYLKAALKVGPLFIWPCPCC